eukprot:7234580-Prymnesium_polylepis.1
MPPRTGQARGARLQPSARPPVAVRAPIASQLRARRGGVRLPDASVAKQPAEHLVGRGARQRGCVEHGHALHLEERVEAGADGPAEGRREGRRARGRVGSHHDAQPQLLGPSAGRRHRHGRHLGDRR